MHGTALLQERRILQTAWLRGENGQKWGAGNRVAAEKCCWADMKENICGFCGLRSEILGLCFKRPKPKCSYTYLIKVTLKKKSFPDRSCGVAGSSSSLRVLFNHKCPASLRKSLKYCLSLFKGTLLCRYSLQALQGQKKPKHNLWQLCETQPSGQGPMYFIWSTTREKLQFSLPSFCSLNGRKQWLRLNRLGGIHSKSFCWSLH